MQDLLRVDTAFPPQPEHRRSRRPTSPGPPIVTLLPLLLVLSAGRTARAQDEDGGFGAADENSRKLEKVLVYEIKGTITAETPDEVAAKVADWRRREPDIRTIVYRIDSPGSQDGKLEPIKALTSTITNLRGVLTVGYIADDAVAGNGAALVALACRRLVMEKNAKIGYLSDSTTAFADEDEDDARMARNEIAALAALRKRDYPLELTWAFVSKFHPDILEVEFKEVKDGNQTTVRQLFTRETYSELPKVKKVNEVPNSRRTLVPSGQRLALSAREAVQYGMAEFLVGDLKDAFRRLDLLVADQDIILAQRGSLKPSSAGGQAVVDFLNHFVIRFFLLLGGFLLLMVEFKMPGTFVPLVCSLACFLLFFTGGFFPVTGAIYPATNVYELLLFFVGLGLVAVEFFLLPGVMVFGLLGLAVVLVSIVLAMVAPESSSVPRTMDPKEAFTVLVFSLALSFGIFFLLLRFLPRSSFFSRSGMITHAVLKGLPTADSILESQSRTDSLIGKVGIALTPCHPSGRIDVDGQIIDVVTQGEFVDKGETVKIIEADAFRAVVEKAG